MTPHGSDSTYTNHRCRCALCVEAHRTACDDARKRRSDRLAADPSVAVHGRYTTYTNWKCRCDECCAAKKASDRKYRSGLVDA